MALPTIHDLKSFLPLIKWLVYSPPGVGKTTFAAKVAEREDMRPVLIVNIDRGESSVMDATHVKQVFPGYNDDGTRNYTTLKDIEDIIWAIISKKPGWEFKTVIIDSISELQARNLEEIVYWDMKMNPKADRNKDRSIDDIHVNDYGTSTSNIRRVVRMLRDAHIHVIITAWMSVVREKKKDGGEGPILAIEPMLTDKLGKAVRGLVEAVWYMYIDEKDSDKQRVILTEKKGVVEAKTRVAAWQKMLGNEVRDPHPVTMYEQLIKAVSKGEK
jgi:KaiC/GvpD/RAD55 family RecA-like ATPase